MGIAAIIAGGLAGMVLIALALLPVAAKHGVDSAASSIPQLGTRGAYYSVFLLYATLAGWNTLLLIFLGRAASEILISFGHFGVSAQHILVVAFGLIGALIVWLLLRGGPDTMRNVAPMISIVVVLLGIYILYLLITQVGWSNIMAAQPSEPSDSRAYNYATGFEILVIASIGWWPYVGGLVRLVPSARKALWPTVIGFGLPLSLLSIIGLFSSLVFPKSEGDPTAFLVDLGGAVGGIPALLFIILANVGTVLVGVYCSAIGLKQIPVFQRRVSWNATTAIALLPVVVVIIFLANIFFDNFGTFLAFVGVSFAPMCGVQIADYYLFRRQRGGVDVKAMFRGGPGTTYHFWGGINPAGFLGIVAGFVAYLYLLNPLSYVSHFPYQYISASFLSAIVAALAYVLFTRLLVLPSGRGGYERVGAPHSQGEPTATRASSLRQEAAGEPDGGNEPA